MSEDNGSYFFHIVDTEPSGWQMTIVPGYVYRPSRAVGIPNRFHRFMQRVFFGFKWERIQPAQPIEEK